MFQLLQKIHIRYNCRNLVRCDYGNSEKSNCRNYWRYKSKLLVILNNQRNTRQSYIQFNIYRLNVRSLYTTRHSRAPSKYTPSTLSTSATATSRHFPTDTNYPFNTLIQCNVSTEPETLSSDTKSVTTPSLGRAQP